MGPGVQRELGARASATGARAKTQPAGVECHLVLDAGAAATGSLAEDVHDGGVARAIYPRLDGHRIGGSEVECGRIRNAHVIIRAIEIERFSDFSEPKARAVLQGPVVDSQGIIGGSVATPASHQTRTR